VKASDAVTAGANESAVPVPPLRGCPCDRIEVCTHWNQHFPGVSRCPSYVSSRLRATLGHILAPMGTQL
jgi:hypothetical protein